MHKALHILLGVSGGIAAYKALELVRLLRQQGAQVRVVMTKQAKAFVQPLSFEALSGNSVYSDLFGQEPGSTAMAHIDLARWADLFLIAPASANLMAKLAHGLADDLLTTLYLANNQPVFLCPAMNQQMWAHPTTQRNLWQLEQDGVMVLGPASGEQACGEIGLGRLLEPHDIADAVMAHFPPKTLLEPVDNDVPDCKTHWVGKRLLITAGPTQEAIDPVRYLSNHSSGKMGFALAEAAVKRGLSVTMVTGPCTLPTPKGVKRLNVVSAVEMYEAVMREVDQADIFIAAAAVADYRPAEFTAEKIKKGADRCSLLLTPCPDILQAVAEKKDRPWVIGFAAETTAPLIQAREKFRRKKPDMLIVNDVSEGKVFGAEENEVSVLLSHETISFPRLSKRVLADRLWDLMEVQFTS